MAGMSFAASPPWAPLFVAAVLISCGGGDHSATMGSGAAGSGTGAGATAGSAGTGAATSTGSTGTGASTTTGAGGGTSPAPTCPDPIQSVDTSSPTTVVGTGTPASCTEAALTAALTKGGVVTFDCGAAPITITVTAEQAFKNDTVIDGGGKVTLSGGGKTRILHLVSAYNVATPKLTVQHLAFTGGFTTDVMNTKATTQGGAAIFRDGGSLDVIDCQFTDNHCAQTGQDVSGGAITSQGIGTTVIVGSTFTNNSGSDGGAVGNLGDILTVVNSTFDGNSATGTDGNPGNGGNGGAIVFDGSKTTMTLCGSTFTHNKANAAGGAVFRVAYTDEPTVIDRCTFDSNVGDATTCNGGALYLEFTTITMTATTISNNTSHYGGGFWVGHSAIANLTNVTVANNDSAQGGGFWFAGNVSGTFLNCTVAGNTSAYGAALFSGSNAVKLENTVFSNNNCKGTVFPMGGTNLGFMGGETCITGALGGDPLLGPLQDNGGPTKTELPAAGSPAIGKGTGCPMTDQRGMPRATACTLGAVEAG
jgi:hypothetical protein